MTASRDFIDVWFIYNEDISDESLLSEYRTLLNTEELQQLDKIYFSRHQQQYLVTRAAIRSILSLYFSAIKPQAWKFRKNSYGKPMIDKDQLPEGFSFNISHTDKLVSIAVSYADIVGIDVEYINRRTDFLGIANSFFSKPEIGSLSRLAPSLQRDRFFDLWTLKEALIKAIGMGLSIPLDQFHYSFTRAGKINLDFDSTWAYLKSDWNFWQILPSQAHKTAIAVNTNRPSDYKLTMREYVPLLSYRAVSYPVGMGHVATKQL